jgi:flavin-binding protein dodecin
MTFAVGRESDNMSDHTYRVIEVVGSSPDGVSAAIRNGLARVSETTRNVNWFEVESVRGVVDDGAVGHYQVTMKVGFRIDDTKG